MRRQLIVAFVSLLVGVILLYGVPRAFVLSAREEASARELVSRGADLAATVVADAVEADEPVTPELLASLSRGEGERVQVRLPDGDTVVVPPGSTVAAGDLRAERVVAGGVEVTYSMSEAALDDRVTDAVTPLVLLGLGLIPIGALAGGLIARRLARPFSELAAAARRMGTGDLDLDLPHYAVPEADEIGAALQQSSRRLDEMLQHERDVATNASHELRTPITALRLALEDVAMWPETSPVVTEELHRLVGEVDRLSAAVTALLDRERERASEPGS